MPNTAKKTIECDDQAFFEYTEKLIESVQRMARARGETRLVHLLELAKIEARFRQQSPV